MTAPIGSAADDGTVRARIYVSRADLGAAVRRGEACRPSSDGCTTVAARLRGLLYSMIMAWTDGPDRARREPQGFAGNRASGGCYRPECTASWPGRSEIGAGRW